MSITLPFQQAAALHRQGKFVEAERLYRGLLSNTPDNFNLLQLLGTVCAQQQRYPEAVEYLQRAIAIDASMASIHRNLGNAQQSLGRQAEAVASYDRSLQLQPGHLETLHSKARILQEAGHYSEALECFDSILTLSPANVDVLCNKGVALAKLKETDAAIVAFEMALALQPDSVKLLTNYSHVLLKNKRFADAAVVCERALSLDADISYMAGVELLSRQTNCDWQQHDEKVQALITRVLAGKRVCLPLLLQMLGDDPAADLQCARSYTNDRFGNMPPLWSGERYRHRKIRVAYLSADFYEHATCYLMAELFELHDRRNFEWYAFSFGPPSKDSMRLRVERAFDHFEEVGDLADSAVAQRLRICEIDIAVDLKGYTRHARPGIFARRPAPVQVNYLDYPGSMGADWMDYVLVDPVLVPPGEEHYYSEKVVRLPDTYQVNDRQRQHGMPRPDRVAVGLPATGFVFCCFNNTLKLTPNVFSVWMRLLLAVEGSVLWLLRGDPLLEGNPQLEANLRREAQARGVAPERLVFAKRCGLQEHLARHQCADLFLDTLPYNAHTAASDALWSGLPLLTCKGRTFASRVAASLLHAIGLPELVTGNLQDYEQLALELARNPSLLAALRHKLEVNRLTTPLFDSVRFAKHMEAAYKHMHDRSKKGLPPAGFDVESLSSALRTPKHRRHATSQSEQ